MPHVTKRMSNNFERTNCVLKNIVNTKNFSTITFDKAVNLLTKNSENKKGFIQINKYGRLLTNKGEIELLKILRTETPVWLNQFDRDMVPFYQKPLPDDKEKTINARPPRLF